MWRNLPKTQKALKLKCLKHLSVIIDKKIFMGKDVILQTSRLNTGRQKPYFVWRKWNVPFWFVDGQFLPYSDVLQDKHIKKKRMKKIKECANKFREEKRKRSFIIVVYEVGDRAVILDGNHRVSALKLAGMYDDYPINAVNITFKGGDTEIGDRLCPDIYVANRLYESNDDAQ